MIVQFRMKKVSLISDSNPYIPKTIFTEPKRLKQIIFNLVSNALKFTRKGKVEVNVVGLEYRAASCFQILEDYGNEDRNKATITFEVRDTGLGIKPKDINKLFSMFGKLDDEEGINKNGCGLGLTICKRLTEQLGGDISVTSIEGKGSTFTFSI